MTSLTTNNKGQSMTGTDMSPYHDLDKRVEVLDTKVSHHDRQITGIYTILDEFREQLQQVSNKQDNILSAVRESTHGMRVELQAHMAQEKEDMGHMELERIERERNHFLSRLKEEKVSRRWFIGQAIAVLTALAIIYFETIGT